MSVDLGLCLEDLARVIDSMEIRGVGFEVAEEGYGGSRLQAYLVVKSTSAHSVDELPIVRAIEEAAAREGLILYRAPYEEESGSRVSELERRIREAASRGYGVIAVVPEPLAVGLVDTPVAGMLESAAKVRVTVRFTNKLYLPRPGGGYEVELVGKRNSMASYRRIEALRARAEELGLSVAGVKYFDSNREIMEYVAELGLEGLHRRVPVNRLALYVIALHSCLGDGALRIQAISVEEEGSHTVYFLGVPPGLLDSFLAGLERLAGPGGLRGESRRLAEGHSRWLRAFAERLGLIVTA